MPHIRCASITCLHNRDGKCNVSDSAIVDVNANGQCLDHSPVTDEEFKEITGMDRKTEK